MLKNIFAHFSDLSHILMRHTQTVLPTQCELATLFVNTERANLHAERGSCVKSNLFK